MIFKNNFKYSKEGIEHPESFIYPNLICKYYGLNSFSFDALQNSYLYASHPLQLNDILDSRHDLYKFKNKPDFDFYTQLGHSELFETDHDGSLLKAHYWKEQTILFGIISLSSNDADSLMWPHYTQEKGFMIQFKTQELYNSIDSLNQIEILLFNPINYVDEVVQLEVPNDIDYLKSATYYSFNTKSNLWKYENEWRIFIGRNGMAPPDIKYYHDFNARKNKGHCIKKRFISYDPTKCIDKIVWGNDFISSETKQSLLTNGKIKFHYHRSQKELFKTLKFIAENFDDKFYISMLRKKNNDNNIRLVRSNRKLRDCLNFIF